MIVVTGAAAADAGFTPVLALGSNAGPAQLARKFADLPHAAVPTLKAALTGFDVVYAPLVSSYGSVTGARPAGRGFERVWWGVVAVLACCACWNWMEEWKARCMHSNKPGSGRTSLFF